MPKPSDDPSFFQRAPPPGQSRESSIVLDRLGRFWHDGELVQHPRLLQRFHAWIRRHPDDGRYILSNGYDWTYFTVEDVPFFVQHVERNARGLALSLSDGTSELLEPASLASGAGGALYLRVKQGAFPARFTPQAQLELAPWLASGPGNKLWLDCGGDHFPIPEDDALHPP
jgi:hypothetical protein